MLDSCFFVRYNRAVIGKSRKKSKLFYRKGDIIMAVKMRLTRLGDKKSPFYRIVVVDGRKARDGEYIEKVGHYNPTSNPEEIVIDADKAKDWLSKGVQPTETVKTLLIRQGIVEKSTKLSAPRTKTRKKK